MPCQGTATSLVGTGVGILLSYLLGPSIQCVVPAFAVLAGLHLSAVYRALTLVNINTLSLHRIEHLSHEFISYISQRRFSSPDSKHAILRYRSIHSSKSCSLLTPLAGGQYAVSDVGVRVIRAAAQGDVLLLSSGVRSSPQYDGVVSSRATGAHRTVWSAESISAHSRLALQDHSSALSPGHHRL